MRVRLRLAKYNLTPVASILVNGEHFRRPILVILKIPKMEMVVCDEVLSRKLLYILAHLGEGAGLGGRVEVQACLTGDE